MEQHTEYTLLSGTRAMMAASVLRRTAQEQRAAATTLADRGFTGPAAASRALGDWYEEVAAALDALDTTNIPIVRA